MSATNKQLHYPAMKSVLEHLRPDSRFELSNRCPNIRTADRSTPLALSQLMFGNGITKVNNTTYQVQIVQYVKPGETVPENDRTKELVLPIRRDIDDFGFYDPSSINATTPGDLNLRDELNQKLSEVELKDLSEEAMLRARVNKRSDDNKPEESRARLEQYRRRKQGNPPPYKFYLKFSFISGSKRHVEYLEYNWKIHEAVKYMNCKLFGGRKTVIVDTLVLEESKYIFRLPLNFKCKVKNLKCDSIDMTLLKNVVEFPSSYNLTVLYNWENDIVHCQPRYKNAKQLTFFVDNDLINYEDLKNLDYQEVHFEHMKYDFLCFEFVRNWLDIGKPVGTTYSFGMRTEQFANVCLTDIELEFGMNFMRRKNGSLFLRIGNGTSQLKVSKKKISRLQTIENYIGCAWCLCLRVQRTY